MTIWRGIDVHPIYQNVTSWAKVRGAGIRWGIQKASENKPYPDAYFRAMEQVGILRGAYHWLHPAKSVTDQADMFVGWLRGAGWRSGFDLPPVLDLEDTDGKSDSDVRSAALAFMKRVDNALGLTDPWRRCAVYMNPDWRRRMGPTVTEGRVLWLAQWPSEFRNEWPTDETDKPAGAGLWQFIGGEQTNLRVPGIASPCDLDIALLEDLQRMAPEFFGQTGEEDMDAKQSAQLDALYRNLIDPGIGSLREKDDDGKQVFHTGGYYLAHTDRNSFDSKAILQQQVLPALTADQQRDAAEALVLSALRSAVAEIDRDLSEEDIQTLSQAIVRDLVGEVTAPQAPRQETQ